MKRHFSITFFLRNFAPLLLAALTAIETLSGGFGTESFCAALLASASLLLMFPLSFEDSSKSIPFVLGQSAVYLLLAFCPFFRGNECMLYTLAAFTGLLAYTAFRAAGRYANIRCLFRLDSVWCSVENFSRMFYLLVFCCLGVAMLTASKYEAPAWVFFIFVMLLAAFWGLNYARAYSGNTLLLGEKREKAIRQLVKGNLRSAPEYGAPDDHMSMIYGKVLRYMESKKPYLQEKFTIDDLAAEVFTNKLYLSRAINYYSGRNFRQFINYYRVMHASAIMQKDRRLKVTEIALLCGFHSLVTFNMAFKLYMNMTPGAYYGVLAARDKAESQKGREKNRLFSEPAMV